jgi:NADPH:quinone reductase-like Zn-dependent oxidoreductase
MLVSTVGLAAPHAVRSGVRAKELTVHSNGAQLTQIAALIDAGTVKPVVSTILPLADAAKAHEMIQTGQVRGKIVLKVRE